MAKFKVKEGRHFEDGVKYEKGQVVETYRDLVAMFPEKFERVIEAPSASSPSTSPPASSPAPFPVLKKRKNQPPARESFDE